MYIPSLTSIACNLAILAAIPSTLASPHGQLDVEKRATVSIPRPTLRGVFTANVNLGPLVGKPIPVPGGLRALQPTLNGTFTGDINGKVLGGLAFPYFNGTEFHFSNILLYGITDDGYSLLIQEAGSGTAERQLTRITMEIGGKYQAYFQNLFLLASVTIPVNTSQAIVQVYAVA